MTEKRVLFVCVHNSARSQMAEAYLNHLGQGEFLAESAGLEAGKLNPVVVEVMKLDGIDISGKATQSVFDLYKQERKYHYVVTVCDESNAEQCPVFSGITQRLHWSIADPSAFTGSAGEILEKTVKVREQIKNQIRNFIDSIT